MIHRFRTDRLAGPHNGRPPRRRATALGLCAAVAGGLIAGCATLGPRTIRGDRFNYNESGAESSKEQILLNIVRLRYGEPLYFLEVASMLSQFKFEAGGVLSAFQNDLHGALGPVPRTVYGVDGHPSRQTTATGNLSYSDSPTITYRPLQGEEFSRRVMTSISPAILVGLAQSGWSIDRLLACCVQQINGIPNRPLHDTDASVAPETGEFRRLLVLFKRIQDTAGLRMVIEMENGVPTPICFVPETMPAAQSELAELRKILGYPERGELRLRVKHRGVRLAPDELAVETRSVLATLYAVALECAVPASHQRDHQAGPDRVGSTDPSAEPWMRIQHSRLPQPDPFVQVQYNGYWFYISRSDWSSKRTFALLTYLFSLQAADVGGQSAPVVTVGAGR